MALHGIAISLRPAPPLVDDIQCRVRDVLQLQPLGLLYIGAHEDGLVVLAHECHAMHWHDLSVLCAVCCDMRLGGEREGIDGCFCIAEYIIYFIIYYACCLPCFLVLGAQFINIKANIITQETIIIISAARRDVDAKCFAVCCCKRKSKASPNRQKTKDTRAEHTNEDT
jgi:hypothetical protein